MNDSLDFLWIVKSNYSGKPHYLKTKTARTKEELERRILERANVAGFRSTIDEYLRLKNWELVQIRFAEI